MATALLAEAWDRPTAAGRLSGRSLGKEPAHPGRLPQPKQFRKMIQQTFQQYASLREEECVMKFFNTLAGFAHIDQETYRCELIVSLSSTCVPWPLGKREPGGGQGGAGKGLCLLVLTCPKMQLPLIYSHQERKGNLGSRSGRWAGCGEENNLYGEVGGLEWRAQEVVV